MHFFTRELKAFQTRSSLLDGEGLVEGFGAARPGTAEGAHHGYESSEMLPLHILQPFVPGSSFQFL